VRYNIGPRKVWESNKKYFLKAKIIKGKPRLGKPGKIK
jgi:hypothetical protein